MIEAVRHDADTTAAVWITAMWNLTTRKPAPHRFAHARAIATAHAAEARAIDMLEQHLGRA